jgi:hypothetical protein
MYPEHSGVIDRNNQGPTVIAYAKVDSDIRLYRTQEVNKIITKITGKIDWGTNEKGKSYAIDTQARDLENGKCIPHSAETSDELRNFVHGEQGKMGGLPGRHDDRLMALTLANIGTRASWLGDFLFA